MESKDAAICEIPALNLVLLTATVTPNVDGWLVVREPGIRLRQYQRSIAAWFRRLALTDFSLAVVETSRAPQEELLKELSRDERSLVRVMHYDPTVDQVRRGKGAIEMGAIRYALTALTGLSDESTIYKCTGRLAMRNVGRNIECLALGSVRLRMTIDRSWADTRLFGATAKTWEELFFDSANQIDDSRSLEYERVVAARVASALALNEIKLDRFPARPIFEGVSGTSGRAYSPGLTRAKDRFFQPLEDVMAKIASTKQI